MDKVFLFIGHRAVYVGVHVPLGRQSRRRHRHRGHKHHRKRKDRGSEREDGRESPSYGKNNSLECLYVANFHEEMVIISCLFLSICLSILTHWLSLSYSLLQTLPHRGSSLFSALRMMMRSIFLMTSSLSSTSCLSVMETLTSGKRQPGEDTK